MEIGIVTSSVGLPDKAVKTGQWTPEAIQRFWEYYGRRSDLHSEYFSYQVGNGITTLLSDTGRFKHGMQFLDYGCGPGFLVEKILAKRLRCYGVDGSAKAVELVNLRFKNSEDWMGAVAVSDSRLPFPDSTFDLITCVETLEHVLEAQLPTVAEEVHRLLKPGGIALFTAPNNENLLNNHVYCPFCETSFHKVQHLRSFSEESLRALVESQGFRTLFCQGIDLAAFQRQWSLPGWRDMNIRAVTDRLRKLRKSFLDRVAPRPFPLGRGFNDRVIAGPHLCALVERPY